MQHAKPIIDDVRRVARRGQGSHLCHFYTTRKEVLELLVPFFADGLEEGQLCIWALPPWLTKGAAQAALAKGGPRLERALDDGTFILVPQAEVYGDAVGRFRGVQGVLDHWLAEERRALERGFLGLRVSGDGTWQVRCETWDEFQTYERSVNDAIGATKITAICTYDLSGLSAEQLKQTLSTHQTGIVRRPEGWEQFACAGADDDATGRLKRLARA